MRKLPYYKQFLYSIYSIKRLSAFRLLSIGKAIMYLFMLMLLSFAPRLIGEWMGTYNGNELASLPLPLPISFLFVYFFTTGYKFIEVSILAALGLLFVSFMKKNLSYKQLWVISAYAITAPTIALSIFEGFGSIIPGGAALLWLASATYLFLAVRAIPNPKQNK